jgi:hypothetical protein
MTSKVSDYSHHAPHHQGLPLQYSALVRFKSAIFGGLAMKAMTSTMRFRIESSGNIEVPRSTEVLAQARQLAAAAGITDDQSSTRRWIVNASLTEM